MNSPLDREAVRRLYEEHARGLLAYACSFVSSFAAAEDIVHQVFERLLRGDLSITNAPVSYLYRAVRNASLNGIRDRAREADFDEGWLEAPSGMEHAAVELQSALRELPEEQREVILLHVWAQMTEVQRGLTLHKVLPGQQVWTGPSSEEQSLAEAIAWSRSAARLAGLLQQPPKPPVSVEAPPAIAETRHQEQPAQAEPQPQQVPAPAPQPERPQRQSETTADERGRQILNRECGSCHAVDAVSNRRFGTREAYADLVSRQIALGASVTDEEFQVLVDYLFKTYGLKLTR